MTSYEEISQEAVNFFRKLLGSADPNVKRCTGSLLAELHPKTLSDEAQADLIKEITPEEIKAAMFAIDGGKSPRPDGFTAHFFKEAWSIVGRDVVEVVEYFFQSTDLSPAFNSTIVALVPKCNNPISMTDFRPISCCAVIYKCITKIMADRLKRFLPFIIERNQSAFIRGRSITDNILLAQEMVRGYGRTTLSPRCVMKIDLRKAFDSLDWDFVLDVMVSLRFPIQYINWIRKCVTTPRFSISVNGGLVGYFKGARGIRQDDPLPPYIFVIAMNVLSNLLNAVAAQGVFKFHPKCKKINFTHLCFTDDLLILTKGDLDSVVGIQKVLGLFYSISGLQLNCEKSKLFSTGMQRSKLEEIH